MALSTSIGAWPRSVRTFNEYLIKPLVADPRPVVYTAPMMRRSLVVGVAGIALLSLGFALGVMSVSSTSRPAVNLTSVIQKLQPTPQGADFSLLQDVWGTVHRTYVNKNIDDRALLQGALSGLVQGLGDPYSVYFPPAEAQSF